QLADHALVVVVKVFGFDRAVGGHDLVDQPGVIPPVGACAHRVGYTGQSLRVVIEVFDASAVGGVDAHDPIAVVFDIQPASAFMQQPGDIAGVVAEDSDRGAGAVAPAQPDSGAGEGPPAAGVIGDHQQSTGGGPQVGVKLCGVHLVEPEVFSNAAVPAGS